MALLCFILSIYYFIICNVFCSQHVLMMVKVNLLKARLLQTSHVSDCSYLKILYTAMLSVLVEYTVSLINVLIF